MAEVRIGGRLASVGQGVIKVVAKREVERAVKVIQERIGG